MQPLATFGAGTTEEGRFFLPSVLPVKLQKQIKHEENLFDSEEFVQEALSTPLFTLKREHSGLH